MLKEKKMFPTHNGLDYLLEISKNEDLMFISITFKVVVSICVPDLFPSHLITSFSNFILPIHAHVGNYFQGCNE
jgi:hypothetical protein